MKVTVKQQPEEFKPVTLEITLETRDEFIAFRELCGSNNSATEAASCLSKELQQTASDILANIYTFIKTSIKQHETI
jgi:hypothetical protein